MAARRARSLHFGDWKEGGKNVVFHREHRSKRGRSKHKLWGMHPAQNRNGKKSQAWKLKSKQIHGMR